MLNKNTILSLFKLLAETSDNKKLKQSDVDAFCLEIQEYYAIHWRDDDNPEIEYRVRSSAWYVLAAVVWYTVVPLVLLASLYVGFVSLCFVVFRLGSN